MKKWLIGIVIALAAFIIGVYIFVPGELSISQVTPVRCSPNGVSRALANKNKWEQWWPAGEKTFTYQGYRFTAGEMLPHGIDVKVSSDDKDLSSRIVIMPLQPDSVELMWQCTYPSSNNPFTRISSYQKAVHLKESFAGVLSGLKKYLEKQENVYGYNITQTSTTDTMLVAAKATSTGAPTTQQVYNLVNQLKNYAVSKGAIQTGYPMLNTTPLGNNQFQFMVAIPVNKELPAKGDLFARRMVPGNFMMTEVKGGLITVADAMQQLQQYFIDHQRTSMAIPFQVLVTNRQQEQDTTKWVTRVYYPVM